MSYLIDTNVISELVRVKLNSSVQNWFEKISSSHLFVSVLTLGELRKGIEALNDSRKKENLRVWLEEELPRWFEGRILTINQDVADRWGTMLAQAKRPLPAIDSLLAATALHFNLRLVTCNVTDFNFTSLEVVNPWNY